jgi:hypothetical protein
MHTAARVGIFLLFALALWGYRWAFVAYIAAALSWMLVETGFTLHAPHCELAVTPEGVMLSMTKFGHVLLFGLFFVITIRQFTKFDRRAVILSILATIIMGLIVELEEGTTGAGNCRMRDLFPDAAGALLAAGAVAALVIVRRRMSVFD